MRIRDWISDVCSSDLIAGALAVSGFVSTPVLAKTELLVYTAAEADELAGFKKAFAKEYPEINIQWVRDSTGIVTAMLLAAQNNPQHDVVSGLPATSMLTLAAYDHFQPTSPTGLDRLEPSMPEQANPPHGAAKP